MHEATLVYPHQLFTDSAALNKERPVYLVEESLILTHNPIHIQKLIFHKLSMDAYQSCLENEGYKVHRITITDHPTTDDVFAKLKDDGISTVHIADTTDLYLEQAILNADVERINYESPLFILPKEDAVTRYTTAKRFMANFYKQLRKDTGILTKKDGTPVGGAWSFDEANRKKLPRDISLPAEITLLKNSSVTEARQWAESLGAETYGEPACWLPYTHADAQTYLATFLTDRFENFGTYEDAIDTRGVRLFHSAISPLLNVGLLTPKEVLDTALAHAEKHSTPINAVEGFVRQILGWREFIRAAYECDGVEMRSKNFWHHTRSLPDAFWNGTTGIPPIDTAIEHANQYGYNHHIERLMVLGNFMVLTETDPHEVYTWFMGMYLDAYDWVMVPNIYGMSQYADGGLFATKPYISGSNYIKKMSNYPKGDWEETWTALYWYFISKHKDFFSENHRLSMMPRLLAKMKPEKREHYMTIAKDYLQK